MQRLLLMLFAVLIFSSAALADDGRQIHQVAHLYNLHPWGGGQEDLFRFYSDGTVIFSDRSGSKARGDGSGMLASKLSAEDAAALAARLKLTAEFLAMKDIYRESPLSDQILTVIELSDGSLQKRIGVSGFKADNASFRSPAVGGLFRDLFMIMKNYDNEKAEPWRPEYLEVVLTVPLMGEANGKSIAAWPVGWPEPPLKQLSGSGSEARIILPIAELALARSTAAKKKAAAAPSYVKAADKIWRFTFSYVYPDKLLPTSTKAASKD